MKYENVPTGDLRVGDRITDHGMILRIDQEIQQSRSHPVDEVRGPVMWTRAFVENWDEIQRQANEGHSVAQMLRSFIRGDMSVGGHRDRNGHGPDTEPRWTIQGNNWARWSRIVEEA